MTWFILFLTLVIPSLAMSQERPCNTKMTNVVGLGEDLTVSSTAIIVMSANNKRCSAIILETSGNEVRCTGPKQTPTADIGFPLKGGTDHAGIALDSRDGAKEETICIATGSDATIAVVETLE